MKKQILLAMVLSAFSFGAHSAQAHEMWEATVCTGKVNNLTVEARAFHNWSDILGKGKLSTMALIRIQKEGSRLKPTEYALASDSFEYTVSKELYLANSAAGGLNILYWKDGRITGKFRLNPSANTELECKQVGAQTVQSAYSSFFAGNQ